MTAPIDILDLIDSAVHDWETSPDAVRYNGPVPAEDKGADADAVVGIGALFRVAAEFEQQMRALGVMAPFVHQVADFAAAASAAVEPLRLVIASVNGSALQLARALRIDPWPHGWSEPCFCHPVPFPAAWDYRRRTKHRNRRRKS